ncbi:MAG: hypothetical protein ACI4F2_02740 [Acutalibacteraceae bacterium]
MTGTGIFRLQVQRVRSSAERRTVARIFHTTLERRAETRRDGRLR